MVLKALEEEYIAIQLLLGVFGGLVLSLELIGFLDGLEPVAFIIAASRLVVLAPRSEAHPAEVVLAHFAGHVVAAGVFLDRTLAGGPRAHLGVRNNPCQILALR